MAARTESLNLCVRVLPKASEKPSCEGTIEERDAVCCSGCQFSIDTGESSCTVHATVHAYSAQLLHMHYRPCGLP